MGRALAYCARCGELSALTGGGVPIKCRCETGSSTPREVPIAEVFVEIPTAGQADGRPSRRLRSRRLRKRMG
jgi:hypothetical protein